MFDMDNEEFTENLKKLRDATKTGLLTNLTDFVNATTYLIQFKNVLDWQISDEQIIEEVKSGINNWFQYKSISDYEKSRFLSVRDMISGSQPKLIYQYTCDKIKEFETTEQIEAVDELKKLFIEDTRKFCAKLSPTSFNMEESKSSNVIWAMHTPVLNLLDYKIVKLKVSELSLSDASALLSLLSNRYSTRGLKEPELPFWKNLSDIIISINKVTPGLIFARRTLLPKLQTFLSA